MRVRKVTHQKSKSNLHPTPQICPASLLHTNLCDRYNHSDRYYYLREMQWVGKKQQTPLSIRVKDYDTLYQDKQVMEKYVDPESQWESFKEVINYYKYYQDIPRIHFKGYEKIILKHVEAKRIKKYSDLKFLVQETKRADNQSQSYSNFMSLLQEELKNKTNSEEDTLICLKEQLSYILQEQSWVQPLGLLNTSKLPLNTETKRWANLSKISNQMFMKKDRGNRGSLDLTKPPEFTNMKVRQKLQKKKIIRFKTMNTPNSVQKININEFNRRLGYNEKEGSRNRSKPGHLSSNSKSRMTPTHTRMHSQPFQSKPINRYLISALEMHQNSLVPKLKKKRKNSNVIEKQSLKSIRL